VNTDAAGAGAAVREHALSTMPMVNPEATTKISAAETKAITTMAKTAKSRSRSIRKSRGP
jgi:hypothetical protein